MMFPAWQVLFEVALYSEMAVCLKQLHISVMYSAEAQNITQLRRIAFAQTFGKCVQIGTFLAGIAETEAKRINADQTRFSAIFPANCLNYRDLFLTGYPFCSPLESQAL